MSASLALAIDAAAEALMQLRLCGGRNEFAFGELARSPTDAYVVASRIVERRSVTPAAWKLGGVTPGMRTAFAAENVCFGAIFPEEMGAVGDFAGPPAPPIFQAEAEIALRLAIDVSSDADLARVDAREIFDAWTYALEAPYSVVANLPEAGLPALLSDRCSAGALYIASPKPIDESLDDAPLQICVDGAVKAEGRVAESLLFSPREAAEQFLSLAVANEQELRRGQWISTGGVTPCISLPRSGTIELRHGVRVVLTLTTVAGATSLG